MKELKRTTPVKNEPQINTAEMQMAVYNMMLSRMASSGYLGYQYSGDRDLYTALGYPKTLSYEQYWSQYSRQDIAGAIINRPVQKTWKGQVNVFNPTDDKSDALRNQWKELYKDLKLKDKFIRIDKLSSLGQFAILLLGFSDIKATTKTKEKDTEIINGFERPVTTSKTLKLNYVYPYGENAVTISEWETDPTNERYGLPKIYTIQQINDGTITTALRVHYSRVLHITGERLTSEVYGIPVLQRVFNRLMDIEKLVGGSAEMFWRGARPGYTGAVDKDFTAPTDLKETLDDQMKEFEHNMRRILVSEGVDIKALEQQIADPNNHVDVQLQMISAITGIPKRILMGSELGELSSTQDRNSWIEYVNARREEIGEEQILIPFIDLLMRYGVLKEQEYAIEWEPLALENEKDKADVGNTRANALKTYASEPNAAVIIPEQSFMKYIMGLTDEIIADILKDKEQTLREDGMGDDEIMKGDTTDEEDIEEDDETIDENDEDDEDDDKYVRTTKPAKK